MKVSEYRPVVKAMLEKLENGNLRTDTQVTKDQKHTPKSGETASKGYRELARRLGCSELPIPFGLGQTGD